MAIDKEVIREKFAKLTEVIGLLERYKNTPREDFLIDFTINSAAQFNLILGIEIIIDIGNHILAEKYQVHPKEYKEIIEALGEYEIIPEDFTKENTEMASFRNLIIHQYEKVNMNLIYQNLQKAPNIFRQFAKYYQEFLDKI